MELVVLLPPSEGKATGGHGRWKPTSGRFGRVLGPHRREVVEALRATELGERQLGVRGELLERAHRAADSLTAGRAKALPAWQRYTGVVWQFLDPATLDEEQRARIFVPSALLGLVTGNDPVPDHRLKFDVRLDGDLQQRLDRYWRPHLTELLRKATSPRTTIVDLLPHEHRHAIDLDALTHGRGKRHIVRPPHEEVGGHDGKAAKGRLARAYLDNNVE